MQIGPGSRGRIAGAIGQSKAGAGWGRSLQTISIPRTSSYVILDSIRDRTALPEQPVVIVKCSIVPADESLAAEKHLQLQPQAQELVGERRIHWR